MFYISEQIDVSNDDVHQGIACDGCKMNPIKGLKYKCSDCHDYHLCEGCYNKGSYSEHEMVKNVEMSKLRKGVKGKLKRHSIIYNRRRLKLIIFGHSNFR